MLWSKQPRAIRDLQKAFNEISTMNPLAPRRQLKQVVTEEVWRSCEDESGRNFESFDEWATAPQPGGLGVQCQETAECLGDLLLAIGHIAEWGGVLKRIARGPGNPAYHVNDEGCRAGFYKITTASSGRDRMLYPPGRFREAICFDALRSPELAEDGHWQSLGGASSGAISQQVDPPRGAGPDRLVFQSRDDGIDRGLLYVAMTRAEYMLVILHSGSSPYVEELYRALGTAPP